MCVFGKLLYNRLSGNNSNMELCLSGISLIQELKYARVYSVEPYYKARIRTPSPNHSPVPRLRLTLCPSRAEMDYCRRDSFGGRKVPMKPDLEAQLSRLPSLETDELRKLWRELFQNPPYSKLRRELLIPILGYRLQERALGGLKPSTARRLRAIADEIGEGKRPASTPGLGPRPGTRMMRQWQGKLHEVITLESGFMYDGEKFRSLSEIARVITGTRWSGPAFFGLKNRRSEEAA